MAIVLATAVVMPMMMRFVDEYANDSYELLAAQPSSMEWNKGTTKATVNVDLAEVGGTVKSLPYSAQVCCCWDSSGSWSSPKAKMKFLQSNEVLTRQLAAWLMMTLLLRLCWTAKGLLHLLQSFALRTHASAEDESGWPFAQTLYGKHNECVVCLLRLVIYRLGLTLQLPPDGLDC